MAMSFIELESTTSVEDKVNHPTGKRSVKYQVMFPDGHDGKGKLRDASTFLKNAIEEYGDPIVGKILFKQMVVQAQAEPRALMKKGTRDETIQKAMLDWKLDEVKSRSVKDVTANAYKDIADRLTVATTIEEVKAVIAEMQAYAQSVAASTVAVTNGTPVEEETSSEQTNGSEEESTEEESSSESTDGVTLTFAQDTTTEETSEELPAPRNPIRRRG